MVQNGSSDSAGGAGGILISGASPTISNVVVRNNASCGIGIFFGAPVILNSTISGSTNKLYDEGCLPLVAVMMNIGGGIAMYGASADGLQTEIVGNTIEDNQTVFGGGGITDDAAGNPTIQNNLIHDNLTNEKGAGLGRQNLSHYASRQQCPANGDV